MTARRTAVRSEAVPESTYTKRLPKAAPAPATRFEVSHPSGTLYTESLPLATKAALCAAREHPSMPLRISVTEITETRRTLDWRKDLPTPRRRRPAKRHLNPNPPPAGKSDALPAAQE